MIVVPGVCTKHLDDSGMNYASGGMKIMCDQPCRAEQLPTKLRTMDSFSCEVTLKPGYEDNQKSFEYKAGNFKMPPQVSIHAHANSST